MIERKGIFYGVVSALLFALLNILVKINQVEFPAAEMMFMRGICGVALLTPLVYKEIPQLATKTSFLAWIRFFAGAIAVYCLFYNIQKNGAGFAVALSNVSSLFVLFFSLIFLKESLLLKEWGSVFVVLSGVFFLHSPFVNRADPYGVVIGMIGALSGGIAMTALKTIATRFSSTLIVWGFSLVCGILAPLLPSSSWSCNNISSFIILMVTGFLGVYGQVFLTKSYLYLSSIIASVFSLSAILWSVLFESIYFQTTPGKGTLVSYGLIFIGLNLLQIFQARKTQYTS